MRRWRAAGVGVIALGAAALVAGVWITYLWLQGDTGSGSRGHPLFVPVTGILLIGAGVGLFSAGAPERTRPTRGDELVERARRAHDEARRDAARQARRAARRARWPFRREPGE